MVLHEIHNKDKGTTWNPSWDTCQCSYCKGDSKLHYGLNIPTQWKRPNSWWVIKYGPNRYIRWTNSWIIKK